MLGLEFLVESRRICPHASRILITAVLSLPTIVDAINKGEIFRFVAKPWLREELLADRKSTRLNSSHDQISYAVFCLKKKYRACSRLDQESEPLPASDAGAGDAVVSAPPPQLEKERQVQALAGGPLGWAHSLRPNVDG